MVEVFCTYQHSDFCLSTLIIIPIYILTLHLCYS